VSTTDFKLRQARSTWVFHDDEGRPIGDFRKAWRTAGRVSGIRVLVHDLRRSAVRNMIRVGIPEHTAIAGLFGSSAYNLPTIEQSGAVPKLKSLDFIGAP
jgi:hypothetical protein